MVLVSIRRTNQLGIVEDHGYVVEVSGNPLGENKKTDIGHPLDQVKILAPIIPSML